MKKTLLASFAFAASCVMAFAQGQISFATFNTSVNALMTNTLTGTVATGSGYYAQLFYGAVGTPEDGLVALTNAPARLSVAGYVTTGSGGGTRYTQGAVVPTGPTAFQVRGWSAALGEDYNAAYTTWLAGTIPTAVLGKSGIITSSTTTAPTPPALLVGLQSFNLNPIPEPSVIALGALGLAAILWRRRK
jgi:hypothetical protein